ncbi:ABC-three component system protein [Pedobacter sp. BG31]|uniref:ABC-three component system protein n=1 Tax=Pedobacter sp. BG31 TaxID=3349697 RepID=UPI0035F265A9
MDYRLELLDENTFESLAVAICVKLFGIGTIMFAAGKDGGRDGKFVGTAIRYPSEAAPWSGKFIIQAKHTMNPIASCADSDFERLIRNEEIPKIKRLRDAGDIEHYLIFTNRKYSGVSGENLVKQIQQETGVENVVIIGKETINNIYLNPSRDLIKQFGLDKHHIPFDFSDQEIKEIILTFKKQLPQLKVDVTVKANQVKYDFDHLEKDEKNRKNSLGAEYYQNVILAESLMEFDKLQMFLDADENSELKDYYFDIAAELNQMIILQRDNFGSFEEIFIYIYQRICDGSSDLKGAKRHVMTFLHYIYMECLIGIKS